jgi:hypothetical protein
MCKQTDFDDGFNVCTNTCTYTVPERGTLETPVEMMRETMANALNVLMR